MDVQTERRKFRRFVPEESAFVAFRPKFAKLGRITDISRGGLGCQYLTYKDMNETASGIEIDVLLSNGKFYMPMIPCRVVYDILLIKDDHPLNYMMETRRCGIEFLDLSEEKREQLEFFLNNHVIASA